MKIKKVMDRLLIFTGIVIFGSGAVMLLVRMIDPGRYGISIPEVVAVPTDTALCLVFAGFLIIILDLFGREMAANTKRAQMLQGSSFADYETQAKILATKVQDAEKYRDILTSMLDDNNQSREALENSLVELEKMQDIMVQSAKLSALGQMAGGVAHEIKNPLGIILQAIGYFENKTPPKDKDSIGVLAMMKNAIIRADKIVNGLLDYSRSSQMDLKGEDINSLLESSIDLVRAGSKSTDAQIVKELGKNIPDVAIDKNRMEQVFINLLMNAIQSTERDGRIVVRSYVARMDDDRKRKSAAGEEYFAKGEEAVMIDIEDNGAGIPQENIQKIFEPFFTTKGTKGGTGLGLGICMSIIDMHKGFLGVESEVGKGTKITVALKIAA